MTRSTHVVAALVWAPLGLFGLFGMGSAAAVAPIEGVDAGDVVITHPIKQSDEIDRGDADTQFSVRLPDGATCPGDSANDQWRVQSFLIPKGEDPDGLVYGTIGPEPVGNGHYALFGADTAPFVHQLTRRNDTPGQPGIISALPPLSFAVVAGEGLPSGTYRIGVACTYFGDTARYWDTEVVVDDPGGVADFRWRAAAAPVQPAAGDSSSASITIWLVLGGAAIVGVALLGLLLRRATPSSTLAKEL